MELIERIEEFLAWIDSDDGDAAQPDWMGGEWYDYDDGSSEAWEFVLLRAAKERLAELETQNAGRELMDAEGDAYCYVGG